MKGRFAFFLQYGVIDAIFLNTFQMFLDIHWKIIV